MMYSYTSLKVETDSCYLFSLACGELAKAAGDYFPFVLFKLCEEQDGSSFSEKSSSKY